jgi:hypothetical protein
MASRLEAGKPTRLRGVQYTVSPLENGPVIGLSCIGPPYRAAVFPAPSPSEQVLLDGSSDAA